MNKGEKQYEQSNFNGQINERSRGKIFTGREFFCNCEIDGQKVKVIEGLKYGEQSADFINCVAFGRAAEFAEKYFRQGLKVIVTGRIQTGSYTNKDGQKVYTTDVFIEEQEFAESKSNQGNNSSSAASVAKPTPNPNPSAPDDNGFMNIPDGLDEELPFN